MTEVLTYEALKAERDAQQKRADALAVENAERGEIIERLIGIFSASGYHAVQNSHDPCSSLLFDAFQAIRQPATSAALAAIQAQGVEKAIERLMNMFASTGHIGIPVMALEGLAKELREAK